MIAIIIAIAVVDNSHYYSNSSQAVRVEATSKEPQPQAREGTLGGQRKTIPVNEQNLSTIITRALRGGRAKR